ncbi:2,3-diaminopropionate biosynthesis protein SbnB [Paenibacillus sp. KS-LC4]|uniref:2,3-diaminopropionate biosynthesis protein SbnB n=1 Tax=Paenibacillus sp. KS-LC4 TaxID=2979727 RepID=UPI0030D4DB2D
MLYLDKTDIDKMGIEWAALISVIEAAAASIESKDYAQPLKPYLRFGDSRNRIIAMPAYIGGDHAAAGIKWVSSFPGNVDKGLPRAHSMLILNNTQTGEPHAVINTALLSTIRTVAITGAFVKSYHDYKPLQAAKVGLIGLGPIGESHYHWLRECYQQEIEQINVFDINRQASIRFKEKYAADERIVIADKWEEAYENCDIVITCTVASKPYIHTRPKAGSLHLNISLRDYGSEFYDRNHTVIIVDDWDEVCREGTSVELMHHESNLQKEEVYTLADVICNKRLTQLPPQTTLHFNPMGMGVFDIAIGNYYLDKAVLQGVGVKL